ncbi:MAG: nicotinamide-nucleotide amidase [Chromatiales bacterium]|jgi:nicotinamide-nucleotide amidase
MDQQNTVSFEQLSNSVARLLLRKGLRLAVAESCTGGWVAMVLTAVPGSSEWFDRGYVTYSNRSKQQMLGVQETTLEAFGAVSEQTVAEMTAGALAAGGTDLALAISGIAGPGGGTSEKPVGTVCFAWQRSQQQPVTARCLFSGDREAVRRQAVVHALQGLIDLVEHG